MSRESQQTTPPKLPQASGNIWGRKFTLISLIIIASMIGLAAYRHWQMGIPFDLKTLMEIPIQDSTYIKKEPVDSIKIDSLR